MRSYAVLLEDVTFTYEGSKTPSIKEISIKIEWGEIVAILGGTGAGKTTLIYTIGGVIPNYVKGRLSGNVIVDGLDTRLYSLYELAQHVGIVMDDPEAHIVSSTVEEDVAFGPCNLGLSRDEVLKRVEFALRATRLIELRHRNPYNLSGGEKQSLAIAGVLAMRPKILALDEPTSMLDPLGKKRIITILRELNKKYGITIVLSSHNAEEIVELANRVIVLKDGEIVLEGSPKSVLQEVELLEKCRVKLPEVTRLAAKLRQEGKWTGALPITLEEAQNTLVKLIIKQEKFTHQEGIMIKRGKEPIVRVRNLTHIYPNGVVALQNLNLDIFPGEYVALIGQNGSGKSTLARIIAGLLRPSSKMAEVRVAGIDVTRARMKDIVRKVGYVFQIPEHQIFHSIVKEELKFGLKNLGFPEKDIERKVKSLLKLLELEGYEEEWPLALDRGKRLRVALGSVLALDPEVIIVDEPTTGQDWRDSLYVCELLRSLNTRGKTVVIITHEMDLVAEFANRVIVMYKGRILLDGRPKEVFSKPEVLKKTWVKPPQVTTLFQSLDNMVPRDVLTAEEAYEYLREVIK